MRHGGGTWRRRFLAPAAVLIVIVAVTSACAKDKKPPSPPTDQSESAILRSFGPNLEVREGGDFGLDRIELERASKEPFSTYLRVQYPKNSGSNQSAREDGTSPGGAQVYLRIAFSEAVMESMKACLEKSRSAYFRSGADGLLSWIW